MTKPASSKDSPAPTVSSLVLMDSNRDPTVSSRRRSRLRLNRRKHLRQQQGVVRAQNELPGSKAVGSALTGNFQPCQTIEAQATLAPGKCYVIVGAGAPPVSEVNVKLVAAAPLPGSARVLAQDADQGVQAVIGRKPNCYTNAFPVPIPVKVVLEVQAGSGVAAAQVYEK
jgi:hypothetical protein